MDTTDRAALLCRICAAAATGFTPTLSRGETHASAFGRDRLQAVVALLGLAGEVAAEVSKRRAQGARRGCPCAGEYGACVRCVLRRHGRSARADGAQPVRLWETIPASERPRRLTVAEAIARAEAEDRGEPLPGDPRPRPPAVVRRTALGRAALLFPLRSAERDLLALCEGDEEGYIAALDWLDAPRPVALWIERRWLAPLPPLARPLLSWRQRASLSGRARQMVRFSLLEIDRDRRRRVPGARPDARFSLLEID